MHLITLFHNAPTSLINRAAPLSESYTSWQATTRWPRRRRLWEGDLMKVAALVPTLLQAMGEDVPFMPMLDRLNRLEQLGWLPDAEEWNNLSRIRYEYTHDNPETPEVRF